MSDKKTRLKRFLKSHILRASIAATVLFSTVFFPLVFAYPNISEENKGVLIVIVVFVCLFEALVYILLTHYLIDTKISSGARLLNDMIKEKNYSDKLPENYVDTAASELSAAVNATADEYTRLEQVHKTFVANASHELRTPLTSVQGFLQAVLDGTASDDDKEQYLKVALSETKRLNALINSMLDLSRLDSGKNPLVFTKFDINDVVREIAAKLEPSLIKKALQINVDFAREQCYVYADKDKIYQVIINLVDNAIKYSPTYSRIILTTSIHEGKVYVTVKDFGYGISKKDQMLIWDRFYMTDKSRTPVKTKGTGLGLSIVKKIIDEHGEVIWVESSRGAGSTFIFTLTLFDPSKHKANKGTVLVKSSDSAKLDDGASTDGE